ncbi:MAG TPA: hypothetical protein VD816_05105 [Ohtaekwangia sp.]|nr:hypothetical protein [Chitinophagaceae bacterium]HYG18282.1 hypothetical protein [Ohtaekwangia sp.]
MKAFRTISAAILALLVLVSSTSFMIGVHFCKGEVKNVALFTKAEGCEKEKSLPPCHRHTKAPCCEDEMVIHEGDDFKAGSADIHIVAPVPADIASPMVLISEIIPSAPIARIQYLPYDPPLRSGDLTISYQVFLI